MATTQADALALAIAGGYKNRRRRQSATQARTARLIAGYNAADVTRKTEMMQEARAEWETAKNAMLAALDERKPKDR